MLRPIRPEDEPLLAEFHKTLSLNTVHSRYFHPYKLESRVAHDRLVRICFIDYDREIAIVAEHSLPNGGREILGVARIIKIHGLEEAEFAVVVTDQYQGQGLGVHLMQLLLDIGEQEGLQRLFGFIMPENVAMRCLCLRIGFTLQDAPQGEWLAEYRFRAT